MADRVLEFVKTICEAWDGNSAGCVMTEDPARDQCSKENCCVYEIAVDCLAKLDVHSAYRHQAGYPPATPPPGGWPDAGEGVK